MVPNGRRWDVERDGAFTGAFAYDLDTAVGQAIRAAQQEGNATAVCIEQPDGSCRHVWP